MRIIPKSKYLRKCCFSLLEITIGISLAAFLLTFLFNNFRHITQANHKMQTIRNVIHDRSILVFRLNQVWNNLEDKSEDKEKKVHFRTELTSDSPRSKKKEIHFIYDNGQDHDSNFCHIIEGILKCDEENQLCLLSKGKNEALHKEILWKNVKECSFFFFDEEKKKWVLEWDKEFLPPLIKISFGEEEFCFPLLKSSHEVKYQ